MRIRSISAFAFLLASIVALFYLTYLRSGSYSPHQRTDVATAIEIRSRIPGQYPSTDDLRQDDGAGPNHSFYIDRAIKTTLRDPESFQFISATLWTQEIAIYGPEAWICQAEYRSRNPLGEYGLPEQADIIFDAEGCRVLNPILERESDAMAASERKTLMYAIKTIHDPFKQR